jgi:cytochrome c oxidase subunit 3
VNQTAFPAVEKHSYPIGAKIGMWLFLFTELLLFGGLFLLYSVYRAKYAADFHHAASELNLTIGTFNTLLLLTSSLTMALSLSALQKNNKRLSQLFLIFTILLGLIFLVNKYFEWSAKFHHGIYPGSEEMLLRNKGQMLFYSLYYVMTGLHGIHVLVGVVVLSVMFYFISKRLMSVYRLSNSDIHAFEGSSLTVSDGKGQDLFESDVIDDSVQEISITFKYSPQKKGKRPSDVVKLENSGLYWHLVDIIWIFLFPLFYLIT